MTWKTSGVSGSEGGWNETLTTWQLTFRTKMYLKMHSISGLKEDFTRPISRCKLCNGTSPLYAGSINRSCTIRKGNNFYLFYFVSRSIYFHLICLFHVVTFLTFCELDCCPLQLVQKRFLTFSCPIPRGWTSFKHKAKRNQVKS